MSFERFDMKYMGSKAKHTKEILPIILENHTPNMWYIEPFVGGGNMIDKVSDIIAPIKFGLDINHYVIEALIDIRDNLHLLPKNNEEFTEYDYKNLRNDDSYPHKGFAGFAYSYSGKWLGGWCRDSEGKRDYVAESFRNACKQSPMLQNVKLHTKSVFELQTLSVKSTIYCDPPYRNATKYSDSFDHDKFYEWCRQKAKEGHIVFVSEYWMPEDFACVWSKEVNSSLTKDTGSKKAVERLFKLVK